MKCLIVEDDPTLSAQLAQAMRDGGFACDLAADGTQGEFLGATESYDLAILDLGLPGLPGLEVLTRWREGGVTMPVLILTARGDWTDKVAGFRAGADDSGRRADVARALAGRALAGCADGIDRWRVQRR